MASTETRWHVNTAELPDVTVEQVNYQPGSCAHGLYESELEAWEHAREYVQAWVADAYDALRVATEEIGRRIERGHAAHQQALTRLRQVAEAADA